MSARSCEPQPHANVNLTSCVCAWAACVSAALADAEATKKSLILENDGLRRCVVGGALLPQGTDSRCGPRTLTVLYAAPSASDCTPRSKLRGAVHHAQGSPKAPRPMAMERTPLKSSSAAGNGACASQHGCLRALGVS